MHTLSAKHVVKSRGVPAMPKEIYQTQPDGSKIKVRQHGDAVFHWFSTPEGHTVIKNSKGYFEYAKRAATGDLVPSGNKYQNKRLKSSSLPSSIKNLQKGLKFSQSQVTKASAQSPLLSSSVQAAPARSFPTTGSTKLLIILVNFNNTSTTYTQTNFNGYADDFEEYYRKNSYGKLNLAATTTAWVTVPHSHDYYGPQSKWGQFAYDAIKAANSAGIDFSDYDNDGDGEVEGVAIIHQGEGQEASGDASDIWSHSWSLSYAGYSASQRTFDGVKVNQYTAQPELLNSTAMSTIGVLCHEFGHNLGLPDFYDTDYSANGSQDGTGHWDLMASGSWNGSPGGSSPANHNSWSKIFLGWVKPTEVTYTNNLSILNSEENPVAYKINTTNEDEYFLLENRQQIGYDSSLPGHGLIVYHVDAKHIANHMNDNKINTTSHQGLYIKSANNTTDASSCPFPGTANKTSFTDATSPNEKSWAGVNTLVPLSNIREISQKIYLTATNNNPWTRVWSNGGDNTIDGWGIGSTNKFYVGDYDGDGDEDLLCTQTGGSRDWMTILYFQDGDWHWGWSNYGDKNKGNGIYPYRHNLIIGDFDGDGKDEILGNDTPGGWMTMFHYDNGDFHWGWSNYGKNEAIMPYRDDLIPGDYDGDGKVEILGNDKDKNGWITMFHFDNNKWNWGWSNYGENHGILPYRDNLISGDYDNDGKDEILGNDIDANGWMTMFHYDNGDFNWGWSDYGDDEAGLRPYRRNIKVGNYDADGKDEILGFASWATCFNYDSNKWNWGWSTYRTNKLYDWPIRDWGSNTKYLFIKASKTRPELLMAMRKYRSKFTVKMYAYTPGQTGTLKSVQTTEDLSQIMNIDAGEEGITAFPNPSNGNFMVDVASTTNSVAKLSIYNSFGQLIHTQVATLVKGDNRIEVSDLSATSGIYIVKVYGGNINKTIKIQIQK